MLGRRGRGEDATVAGSTLRLAVVSSPRVGNMWVRRQLVALYGLEERSAHTPAEVGWGSLPDACVLQLHWPRTRAFERTLQRRGFRVIVLGRHPLDILISILHFAPHEPETARWLDGAGGDEHSIFGAEPTSEAFRTYATGPRARALLDVTNAWWEHGLVAIRYEDLVAAPPRELGRVVEAVGATPRLSPDEVDVKVVFDRLQAEAVNQHFWQGKPNQWRELLPAAVATDIARPYAELLRRLDYDVQPDPGLTHEEAARRWRAKLGAATPSPRVTAGVT